MNLRLPNRSRVDPPAILVATIATMASFALVLSSLSPDLFATIGRSRTREPRAPNEQVVFIAPAPIPIVERRRAARSDRAARTAAPAPPARAIDSSARAPVVDRGTTVTTITHPAQPVATDAFATRPAGGRGLPAITLPKPLNPFAPTQPPTSVQRDSMLNDFRMGVSRAAATRVATSEDQDVLWRGLSRPGTIPGRKAGEQGIIALPSASSGQYAGGASAGVLSVPFLSPGPSRAERVRDSTANAQFLRVWERLSTRARTKHDSMRIADSIRRHAAP